jgi:hypothetical protein
MKPRRKPGTGGGDQARTGALPKTGCGKYIWLRTGTIDQVPGATENRFPAHPLRKGS